MNFLRRRCTFLRQGLNRLGFRSSLGVVELNSKFTGEVRIDIIDTSYNAQAVKVEYRRH